MLTEVIKSTEANMATNRRFYEEVINQKRLAVVDEVAGANSQNLYQRLPYCLS